MTTNAATAILDPMAKMTASEFMAIEWPRAVMDYTSCGAFNADEAKAAKIAARFGIVSADGRYPAFVWFNVMGS